MKLSDFTVFIIQFLINLLAIIHKIYIMLKISPNNVGIANLELSWFGYAENRVCSNRQVKKFNVTIMINGKLTDLLNLTFSAGQDHTLKKYCKKTH